MVNEFGEGPAESNVDFAAVQARQRGNESQAGQVAQLPQTGFVSSINGLGGPVILGPGSVPPGVTVVFTQGVNTISFNLSGLGSLATVKCTIDPTNDPGVNDDSSQGYSQFSQWINESIPQSFQCLDATIGAAVWAKLAP